VVYFIECRNCKAEIIIDRGLDENRATALSGAFHTFPDCPNCGARHLYDSSDVKTRTVSEFPPTNLP
jgi:hypothetical protein